jgi:integrase
MATGKRGDSFYYSLSITVDGVRRQEYRRFATAAERDVAYNRRKVEVDEGVGLRLRGDTLSSYLREWVEGLHTVRPSTQHAYTRAVENWIIPYLGKQRLAKLRIRDVKTWHARLAADGLAPASVVLAHRVLGRALGDALLEGEIRQNVARLARAPTIPHAETAYWSPESVAQFLNAVRGHAWSAPFLLMLGTGLRVGECAALRWEDVDLAFGSIRVRRTMSKNAQGQRVVGSVPKSRAGTRSIRLDDSTAWVLREQQDRLRFDGRLGVWVFPREGEDAPIAYSSYRHRFGVLCNLAGVEPMGIHGLRHTYATLLIAGKVGMLTVAQLLGHASISTTMDVYGHVLESMEDEAARVIGEALDRPKVAQL